MRILLIRGHTASSGGNSLNRFRIDPNTGDISSNVDYDVDGGAMPTTVTLTVKVTDKGGLSDNTTVTLNILDSNDNRPVVINGPYDYTVQPCNVRAGRTLGTMVCQDKDSSFQGNNDTYFSSSGGTGLTILASGAIILKDVPPEGTTYTVTVYCYDRGQYPNPLQSLAPTIVSVTGIVSYDDQEDDVDDDDDDRMPNNDRGTTSHSSAQNCGPHDNDYFYNNDDTSSIHCQHQELGGPEPAVDHDSGAADDGSARSAGLPVGQVLLAGLPQVLSREMVPEIFIIGSPDAYLYDFWKERYPDDDYGKQPNRQAPPLPVDSVPQEDGGKSVGQPLTSSKKSRTYVCIYPM
ncbi:hypothetical protein C0Q70_07209 [Pomacea canaliculata]|uniref:Cadherin domain-containing protein n=1 Tax=Pomacea canaliculata TaxID=400727 RepID=A0A2T7PEF1_POMCA|nr:hypothetical protein C0Q70_07209 [Pomacea canaliculata]